MGCARSLVSVLVAGCLAGLFFQAERTQVPAVKPSPPLQNLKDLLPHQAELQGWKAENAPQVYKGEDLYLYIDGGAEIYHEYGFRQVLVQDYQSTPEKSLTLEIYEMADSPSAFGIYTLKSSGKGKTVLVGQDGQLEDYYLNFWKGNFLVTLTGSDGSPEIIHGLLLIAKSLEAKINPRATRPLFIEALPKDWFPVSRLKYIKGALGLRNTESFLSRSIFGFQEGVVGVNDEKRLGGFVFRYSSAEECRRQFQASKAAFEISTEARNFRNLRPDFFTMIDSQGRAIYAQAFEDCLALVMTGESQEFAAKILSAIRDNCAKLK